MDPLNILGRMGTLKVEDIIDFINFMNIKDIIGIIRLLDFINIDYITDLIIFIALFFISWTLLSYILSGPHVPYLYGPSGYGDGSRLWHY